MSDGFGEGSCRNWANGLLLVRGSCMFHQSGLFRQRKVHKYFKRSTVFISIPRRINPLSMLNKAVTHERPEGSGVGTLIHRHTEGFEVVAAAARRVIDHCDAYIVLFTERARSRRRPEHDGDLNWSQWISMHNINRSHLHDHAKSSPTRTRTSPIPRTVLQPPRKRDEQHRRRHPRSRHDIKNQKSHCFLIQN